MFHFLLVVVVVVMAGTLDSQCEIFFISIYLEFLCSQVDAGTPKKCSSIKPRKYCELIASFQFAALN